MEIIELDPFDDVALAAWHATYLASVTHQREFSTPWMLEEVRADFRADNPGEKARVWSGVVDGDVVVAAAMFLPLMDNRHQAWVELNTRPDVRNRGHASSMLDHLVEVAREQERTTLLVEAAYPYAAPVDGAGEPNADFLTRRGFTFALGDVQRLLNLPVDAALLDTLIAESEPHHEGYEIRQFRGPVPDDIIESFGELVGSLVTEAPAGEMEWEPELFDATRIRADEAIFAASKRTKYITVAIRGGVVAAYTELVVPDHDPGKVFQWGTLARPEHRGHRLGLAVKARNLRWLQQERPDLKRLSTYNAEVNEHMIGVNELMGFRPVERLGEFQRKVG